MDASQKLQRRSSGDGHLIRSLLAGSAGNFLEFFDFALFGMFANEISATFFPPDDSATETKLLTFLVFGTGFTMRPIGGLFFGYIGDTVGRECISTLLCSALQCGLWALQFMRAATCRRVCNAIVTFDDGATNAGDGVAARIRHARIAIAIIAPPHASFPRAVRRRPGSAIRYHYHYSPVHALSDWLRLPCSSGA
eukprot:SAG31_NODE_1416_length_8441_cov_11.436706_6_plen_195_part_00